MELTKASIYELAPFAATLGLEFERLDPGEVVVELPIRRALSTVGGGLHGGAIMSLVDVAGALVCAVNIDDDASYTTVQSSTSFLRSIAGARAVARAVPTKVGRTLVNVEVNVHDDGGRRCAHATQVLQLLR